MNRHAEITPLDNAWLLKYYSLHLPKTETYKTFEEVVERLKFLLDVTWIESQF